MIITFLNLNKTLKALKLFTSPKDIRIRYRNIHLFAKDGVLYAEATNGHIMLRIVLLRSTLLIDGDCGQYSPELLEFGYFKLEEYKLFNLHTDAQVPQCEESGQYPDTSKALPLVEVPGMIEVTERYKIALKYQVIVDKAITLVTGVKNLHSRPQRFKVQEFSNDIPYEYRNGDIAIAVMPMRDE